MKEKNRKEKKTTTKKIHGRHGEPILYVMLLVGPTIVKYSTFHGPRAVVTAWGKDGHLSVPGAGTHRNRSRVWSLARKH